MSPLVSFEVVGVPASQGNKTAYVRGGRAVLVEGRGAGRQKHADWRQAVATAARDWVVENGSPAPLDGPLRLSVAFALPKPASAPKAMVWAHKKPDLDKLLRAVLDSLSGIVIVDDARIVSLDANKRYAIDCAPGCSVMIWRAL